MSTATATHTPAETVKYAHAVLHEGIAALPQDCPSYVILFDAALHQLATAAVKLGDALDLYGAILEEILHPECVYPDLIDHPEQKHAALELAAREAGEAAEEVTEALARRGAAAAGQGAGK